MKLEQQVVSEEIGMKLKEMGLDQDTCFSWVKLHDDKLHIWPTDRLNNRVCAAFTAAELARYFNVPDGGYYINCNKGKWFIYFSPENGTDNSYSFEDYNLANAMASMIMAQHIEGEFNVNQDN